ncbi:TipAS antibiotic-recognition domain-containing protein [Nocardia rhamnosiphila]|uniref:TipAS antibiotic-recognition domain-containing protein n=1 Tax=Nocardia rhamnosiphila TaxID=426716 RepID=UPI0022482D4C|nr:TipAS antibiotic-recognition domain-containing protein [Nocardia zapadnayensis]
MDCTAAIHVRLGRGYVEDARMRAYYDGIERGPAVWRGAVIEANQRAPGVDPDETTRGRA